jgi:catechol-2,3-dioxygenase
MSKFPEAQLGHVGLYAFDLGKMVSFYERTLGFVVTDRGRSSGGAELAFLSRNPAEHHQVAIAEGRPRDATFSTIQQLSLRVPNLEDLRGAYQCLVESQVDGLVARNHGNAWSIYFRDPEGNRLEVYCPSPWYVKQPFAKPLDLNASVERILSDTEEMVRNDPTFKSAEAWSADLQERLANPAMAK